MTACRVHSSAELSSSILHSWNAMAVPRQPQPPGVRLGRNDTGRYCTVPHATTTKQQQPLSLHALTGRSLSLARGVFRVAVACDLRCLSIWGLTKAAARHMSTRRLAASVPPRGPSHPPFQNATLYGVPPDLFGLGRPRSSAVADVPFKGADEGIALSMMAHGGRLVAGRLRAAALRHGLRHNYRSAAAPVGLAHHQVNQPSKSSGFCQIIMDALRTVLRPG